MAKKFQRGILLGWILGRTEMRGDEELSDQDVLEFKAFYSVGDPVEHF